MRYVKPFKLKVMTIAFFGTGIMGIGIGLYHSHFNVTLLGVINLCLGGFVGWMYLTQGPKLRKNRKKK